MKKYLNYIADEIFNIANTIEYIEYQGVFDIINNKHPRMGYKNRVKIYAYVCEMLFGDNAEEIIFDMI